MKNAKLITKPVTWQGTVVLKYQSMLEYPVNERIIRILGDPMSSQNKAKSSLYREFRLWQEAMNAFNEAINDDLYENNN